jgi:hypothetical protein
MSVRASVTRFVRAVVAAAGSGAVVAAISASDGVRDLVTDAVAAIPVLSVENEATVSFIVFGAVTAALLAIDKELRDRGLMPAFLGGKVV